MGAAWRNGQGPSNRQEGRAWSLIREFCSSVTTWYQPGSDITSLEDLDTAMIKLLQDLVNAGG